MTDHYSGMHNVIPTVMEYAGRDEPADDIYARLLQGRIVFLRQHINDQSANLVVAQLLFLDRADPGAEIQLIISAPSGDVYAGLALYNTLQQLKAPVRTVASGLVGSYGTMLLAAGTPGRRYAQANATIHLHQPLGEATGRATDLTQHAEQLLRLRGQIVAILAHHTGLTPERLRHDIARDLFFSPAEAMAYGLVDDVLTQHGTKGTSNGANLREDRPGGGRLDARETDERFHLWREGGHEHPNLLIEGRNLPVEQIDQLQRRRDEPGVMLGTVEVITIYGILRFPEKEAPPMAHVQFTDVQDRPTEFLDFTSVTLDEFQQLIPPFEAAFQGEQGDAGGNLQPRVK